MPIPLGGDYSLAVDKPIDTRMVWSGSITNITNMQNKYAGLISYVTGDQNLYVCRSTTTFGGGLVNWERILTSVVDISSEINSDITLNNTYNGLAVRVNSSNIINVNLPNSSSGFPIGFNVTFIQMGDGYIQFNNVAPGVTPQIFNLRNRLGLNKTAGQYAVASLLRIANTADIILYGDLV